MVGCRSISTLPLASLGERCSKTERELGLISMHMSWFCLTILHHIVFGPMVGMGLRHAMFPMEHQQYDRFLKVSPAPHLFLNASISAGKKMCSPMWEEFRWMAFLFAFAGAGWGHVTSVATCPLDVIKTKLQAQTIVGPCRLFRSAQWVPMSVHQENCSHNWEMLSYIKDNYQAQWVSRFVPWARADNTRLSSNMGYLFHSIWWNKDQVWGDTSQKHSPSLQYLSRGTSKGY